MNKFTKWFLVATAALVIIMTGVIGLALWVRSGPQSGEYCKVNVPANMVNCWDIDVDAPSISWKGHWRHPLKRLSPNRFAHKWKYPSGEEANYVLTFVNETSFTKPSSDPAERAVDTFERQ